MDLKFQSEKLKFFRPYEFECCVPKCSIVDMDSDFLRLLDSAREFAGVPFVLNSAYRSVEYELSKGRSGGSSHTKGCAVDIRCDNDRKRYLIVNALLGVGFSRIGVAKSFIHVDMDFSKPSAIWLYK